MAFCYEIGFENEKPQFCSFMSFFSNSYVLIDQKRKRFWFIETVRQGEPKKKFFGSCMKFFYEIDLINSTEWGQFN